MIDYPITNLTVRELRDMIREVVREVVREEANGARDLEGSVSRRDAAIVFLLDAHQRLMPFADEQTDDNLAKARVAVENAILALERKESVKAAEVDEANEIG